MAIAATVRSAAAATLSLLLLAAPAAALDFSLLTPVYDETYVGETSYPTTPEVDDAGMGGMMESANPLFEAPTLTGTVAHASIAFGDPHLSELTFAGAGALTHLSIGLRGDFANATVAFENLVHDQVACVGANSTTDSVSACLQFNFEELELHSGSETQSDLLPLEMTDALEAGASFTLDLLVDRGSGMATASINVAGVGSFTLPLPVAVSVGDFLWFGQSISVPAPLVNPGEIVADLTRFRVYKVTPSAVGWGLDANGQASPPASVNGVVGDAAAVAGGELHGCAIEAATGNVVCWGLDLFGETVPPADVNGASGTASAITAGDSYSCAIQAGTGHVVCWGVNNVGQTSVPDSVNGVSGTASFIAAGISHTCALQAATGNAVCWGLNNLGQSTPPSSVNGVSGTASSIAAGGGHSCAVQAGTGNVICWGDNSNGQAAPPNAVNGVSGTAVSVAARSAHSCAIQAGTQAVVCWGLNSNFQATPPDSVNGVDGAASALSLGAAHSCAIQAGSGNVVCWGSNVDGQSMPANPVNGIAGTASALSVGFNHVLAIHSPLPAEGLTVYVTYSSESIVSGPLSLGLSSLPGEMYATIHLPGILTRSNVTAGLADVGSFALVLGDALSTELTSFSMTTNADGEVTALTYTTVPINTATADGYETLNSFSATVRGTDTSSGNGFEYSYAASTQVLTGVSSPAANVPDLGAWGLVVLLTLLPVCAWSTLRWPPARG